MIFQGHPGSLPPLQSNQEIDITMELRRIKKPSYWPQLDPVNSSDPETLIGTEFVAIAAWTGAKPNDSQLEEQLRKSEVDLFRLPKEFMDKISDSNQSKDDAIMEDEDDRNKLVKDSFPLPKEALFYNQEAVLIKVCLIRSNYNVVDSRPLVFR